MKYEKQKKFITFLPSSVLYLVLAVFAVLFTQLLKSPASSMLLWFVCALPFVLFLYTFFGRNSIQIYVSADKSRCSKNEEAEYEIRIINNSFLPFPFVTASVIEPGEGDVRCVRKKLVMSMLPFAGYSVKQKVRFKYRGLYEIGVDYISVSDPLHLFELNVNVYNYAAVTVLPGDYEIEKGRYETSENTPVSSQRQDPSKERIDVSDIKDYVPGDRVKDIHWKLSSKNEELKVRHYSTVENKHTYVLCDLSSAIFPPEKSVEEIYGDIKKIVGEKEKERLKRRRFSKAAAYEALSKAYEADDTVEEDGFFARRKKARQKRKADRKYRRNIKSGMSEKQADLIRMIDGLIEDTDRLAEVKAEKSAEKAAKKEDKHQKYKNAAEIELEKANSERILTEGDLERILSSFEGIRYEYDGLDRAYGGRVLPSEIDDFNEFCTDKAVEITLALAKREVEKGNRCTVLWYDDREDGGVMSVDITAPDSLDICRHGLATARILPERAFVSKLSEVISETTDVTLKVVTTNLDPVSLGELCRIPVAFGGAGSGCNVEVNTYCEPSKYELPIVREGYMSEVAGSVLRSGEGFVRLRDTSENGSHTFGAF